MRPEAFGGVLSLLLVAGCASNSSQGAGSASTQSTLTPTSIEVTTTSRATVPTTTLPVDELLEVAQVEGIDYSSDEGTWHPILATMKAKPPPTAATCPTGSDPDTPGPTDTDRPEPGWVGNAAAAFDQHTGRIIYVDLLGDTWAFDVCTNTWTNLHPEGARVGEATGLVYDVDSDRLIALGEYISVYDPNENAWSKGSSAGSFLDFWPAGGAVYDPTSGLVVTQHMGMVKTYDVDTDRWTAVGTLPEDPFMLLAYVPSLDRILCLAGLVDPRSGEPAKVAAEPPSIAGGFGSVAFATSGDTAYVTTDRSEICRFEATSLEWTCLARNLSAPHFVFAAMVFDSINNRLVLINSVFGDWRAAAPADVRAIDIDTGEWIQLLEASD